MTFTLSVSITNEQADFLKDNPDLSPSKMLQAKIMEIQDNRKLYSEEKRLLENNIKRCQETIKQQASRIEFLEDKLDEGKKDNA